MATDDLRLKSEDPQGEDELEHPGGGRFNRSLLWIFAGAAIMAGVVAGQGIRSSGVTAPGVEAPKLGEDAGAVARDKGEVEDLAAHGAEPRAATPSSAPPPTAIVPHPQAFIQRQPGTPGRYAQWAEEKYLKALEAPQMVSAFHNDATLEIASAKGQGGAGALAPSQAAAPDDNQIALHPPASPYTVMAGSVLPAVLSPTRDLARRVERVFGSIERIAHDGRQIALTREHREPFRFFGYDDDWTAAQERREAA